MELTVIYIISQVCVVITYLFLALSYYAKSRKVVLLLSFLSLIANGATYVLLNAYSGFAMCVLAFARNIIFMIDEKKNGQRDKINRNDIIILTLLYIASILSAIFTFDGFLSLLSVIATMLYTYSVWQKKTKVYKLLGMPIGVLWILYNLYVKSVLGVILEAVLLICSTTGYILEVKKDKKKK